LAFGVVVGCATAPTLGERPPSHPGQGTARVMIDRTFLGQCAFVSIDIQESGRPAHLSYEQIPTLWRAMGFTAEDVNAANDFAWNVALPNAVKVAEACRELRLPMIFIHWGYLFEDGMDLDPEIRKAMLDEHGTDYAKWTGHIAQPGSQPAEAFGVRQGDYVLAKAAQDAFRSCNLEFVVRNLHVKNLVFVGGHTGACLGKTAASAKRLGFKILCITDATTDARESSRLNNIEKIGYDFVMTTAEFLALVKHSNDTPTKSVR
jgi:nicotinamidase-related amidase